MAMRRVRMLLGLCVSSTECCLFRFAHFQFLHNQLTAVPLSLVQVQRSSRSLYCRILRESRQLEPNTREFYRRFARSGQGFPSQARDTDPVAIQDHIRRVEKDINCVLLDRELHSA